MRFEPIGFMEFGDGVPATLPGHENIDDGGDITMSEIEEGELVDMISKTDLGDNNVVIPETGSLETKVRSETLDKNESGSKMQRRRKNKKKKKKNNKNKGNNGTSSPNITDVNRFVINVCKRLREKKSYLVWTAVACLGVSALSDLVKEMLTDEVVSLVSVPWTFLPR
ncbi:unnamed protein product [Cuscuta campestris]|uniref:Phosphorylated adapter RNA export protein n=1 Tax=Cuscuta campestris TaxID=132261 RepID=A0A484M0S3_9ASTE|nr:unnamed protein product [Cuscuta campestris]